MKKHLSAVLLTASIILTGCNNSDPDIIDINDFEQIDLSYKLKTDLPCAKVLDAYDVEECEIDWENECKNGAPVAYDGESFYYMDPLAAEDEPMILIQSFNPTTKEEKELMYYPALEKNKLGFHMDFAALHNSHFFFFGTILSNEEDEYYFYDIDLSDGSTDNIRIDKLPGRTLALTAYENCLYFGDSYKENEGEDGEKETYIITKYDINSKSFSTFKTNAKIPNVYKNGILYYHDGGLFYSGDENVPDTGVIFNGDKMLLSVDEYFMKHYPYKDKIFYRCYSYDNTDYRTFGYFDDKLNRHDLAESVVSPEKSEFSSEFVFAPNADLMSFSIFGAFDEKPIIYDIKNNIFAAIEVGNSFDHFYAFSDDDSIVLYLRGHYLSDESNDYVNAKYYKISRKRIEDN